MKLGDVVKINPENVGKDYPFKEIEYIDISSVSAGILKEAKHIMLEYAPSRARRIVKRGETLLSTVRPNLRSFWYARNPSQNMIASTGFAVLRSGKKINPRFLYYTVSDQLFTDYLTANAKGAAYPAVDIDTIARAEINLPTLPTQQKIAAILSAYDDLIENNLRRIKILEEMAQALYREWFVHFRFPGHEKVRLVDSSLGQIPEGWEAKNIGSLLSGHIGGGWGKKEIDDKHSCHAYVIRGTDISQVSFMEIGSCPSRYHTESNLRSRRLRSGDIIYEVSGGGKETPVGRVLMITENVLNTFHGDVICASFCKRMTPNSDAINPLILFYHLEALHKSERIEQYQVQSTGIKNLKFSVLLENEFIATPPLDIQKYFESYVNPIIEEKEILSLQNVLLGKTRDLLLPKLISGELDVSDLKIAISEEA